MLKLSKYIHIAWDEEVLPNHGILFSTRSGVAMELKNQFIEYLKSNDFESLPFTVLEELIHAQVLVPEYEDELQTILEANKANIYDVDKRHLAFTLQPSGNCQLGCHYCGQLHSKKVASNQTIELITGRIESKILERKDSLKSLSITWYGGEPLTGLNELTVISSNVIKIANQYGLKYSADMITNGLILKKQLFEKLVTEHKIMAFQITIDGTAEYHNLRRNLKTGGPTFEIILKNIKEIVSSDFYKNGAARINLRCNVDKQNKDNIFELLELLNQENILPFVGIYCAAVHDWGDIHNTTGINGISKEEFAEFEIEFFMAMKSYGLLNPDSVLPKRNMQVCMVASQTSEVLDAFGNVSTCWEVPYTPAYNNTKFYVGNLHQNPGIISTDAPMRKWNDEIPVNSSWCKSCKFLPVCGGSCPKSWYNNTPACPSFKFNIDERLFLKKLTKLEEHAELV